MSLSAFAQIDREPAATADQFRRVFTEEQRLAGFGQHELDAKKFDRNREAGVGEVLRQRQAWDTMMAKQLPAFKKEKAKEVAPLDETSASYKASLKERVRFQEELEKDEREYVRARDKARKQAQSRIHLSEEQEYALLPEPQRVSLLKREMYSGKFKGSSSSSGSRGGGFPSGGAVEAAAPPPPSIPPPPNPNDFYEPEIPPPPPPLDGTFEDAIPPPIFDEPEF